MTANQFLNIKVRYVVHTHNRPSAGQQWDEAAKLSKASYNDHLARCRTDDCHQQATLEKDAE